MTPTHLYRQCTWTKLLGSSIEELVIGLGLPLRRGHGVKKLTY